MKSKQHLIPQPALTRAEFLASVPSYRFNPLRNQYVVRGVGCYLLATVWTEPKTKIDYVAVQKHNLSLQA